MGKRRSGWVVRIECGGRMWNILSKVDKRDKSIESEVEKMADYKEIESNGWGECHRQKKRRNSAFDLVRSNGLIWPEGRC